MRILYLSYDGMTDPLGESQVLSYLTGLASLGHQISLISFEKKSVYQKRREHIEKVVNSAGINWVPLTYHNSPPILGTFYDLLKGWSLVKSLIKSLKIEVVHCRGYITALLGQRAKRKFGTKFVFDMRGWWPDEKVESGFWKSPVFRPVYRYFKSKERSFFKTSDITVSLTEAGKQEILRQVSVSNEKVLVVPTCVDLTLFKEFNPKIRSELRQRLGIDEKQNVLVYSGSLGANYPLSMLASIFNQVPGVLIVLTKTDHEWVRQGLRQLGVEMDNVRILSANREEVGSFLMMSDQGLIFYKPAFSTIGRSPTKLAEYWACGIPVLGQKGVGDLDILAERYDSGLSLFDVAADQITIESKLSSGDKAKLRAYATEYADLKKGVDFYHSLYAQLSQSITAL